MKRLALIACIASLASFAQADDAETTSFDLPSYSTLGVIRIDSTNFQTIVAIPWVAWGTNSAGKVTLNSIIDPSTGFTDGDKVYYLEYMTNTAGVATNSYYHTWVYDEDDKKFVSVSETTKTSNGTTDSESPDPDTFTVVRNSSFIIKRSNCVDTEGNAIPFYLRGQVAQAGATSEVSLPAGQSALISMPADKDYDLNTDIEWSGVTSSDVVNYVDANNVTRILRWDGENWYRSQTSRDDENKLVTTKIYTFPMKAGSGFWYSSKGTTAPTVTWGEGKVPEDSHWTTPTTENSNP